MGLWCERCGVDVAALREGLPCRGCWTGEADGLLAERLVQVAGDALEAGNAALAGIEDPESRDWVRARDSSDPNVREAGERARRAAVVANYALEPLKNIVDPRAAPALQAARDHQAARVRAAVIRSLGRSGSHRDVADVATALVDLDGGVRSAARVALAELGGQPALDELAARLDGLDGVDRVECLLALAWLRDPRVLAEVRELASEALAGEPGLGAPGTWLAPPHHGRLLVRALLHIGEPEDVEHLKDRVAEEVRSGDYPRRATAYGVIGMALHLDGRDASKTLERWRRERESWSVPSTAGDRARTPTRREVPRLTLAELVVESPPAAGAAGWPAAKFGGQPDWRERPQWPIATDGRPLTFYGQLPLPGTPSRTAYIFVSNGEAAETWAALGDGNAVVVQPGPAPHLQTVERATGPQLFERVEDYSGFQP